MQVHLCSQSAGGKCWSRREVGFKQHANQAPTAARPETADRIQTSEFSTLEVSRDYNHNEHMST